MTQHRTPATRSDVRPHRKETADALRRLRDLSREAKTLVARIDAAQSNNRASSSGDPETLCPKPDRRVTSLPVGAEGKRRR